jgi:hypothetical protein
MRQVASADLAAQHLDLALFGDAGLQEGLEQAPRMGSLAARTTVYR